MVEILERIAERSGSANISGEKAYSERGKYSGEGVQERENCSTFAEMYLEKPVDVQMGVTCTVCTWRGIPTIDDW